MNSRVELGYRIALVDSDALQRVCTGNTLTALGADFTTFLRLYELVEALGEGQHFDGIIVGLHADAHKTVFTRMAGLEDAAGRVMPILYVTHRSELAAVQTVPPLEMARQSFRLLYSPVEDVDLLAWLHTLEPWTVRPRRAD